MHKWNTNFKTIYNEVLELVALDLSISGKI